MESIKYSQKKCNFCNEYHKLGKTEEQIMPGFVPSLSGLFSQDEIAFLKSLEIEPIPNIELIVAMHSEMNERNICVDMPHKYRILPQQEEVYRPVYKDKSMSQDEMMLGFIPWNIDILRRRFPSLSGLLSQEELAILRSFNFETIPNIELIAAMYPEMKPRNIYANMPHAKESLPQQEELHLPAYKDTFNIRDETFEFDVDPVKMIDDLLKDE